MATNRDGYYEGGITDATQLFSTVTTLKRSYDGFFEGLSSFPVTFVTYKNQGYYVAGLTYEEWVTISAPSTTPPSGHTLTGISYVVLQQ